MGLHLLPRRCGRRRELGFTLEVRPRMRAHRVHLHFGSSVLPEGRRERGWGGGKEEGARLLSKGVLGLISDTTTTLRGWDGKGGMGW